MCAVNIEECIENKVFHGCKRSHRNPKMMKFIRETVNGIDIINLDETISAIDNAAAFLEKTCADGGKILFVAPQKVSKEYVKELAKSLSLPYVTEKWVAGNLTNFVTIRKTVKRLEKSADKSAYAEFLSKKEIRTAAEQFAKSSKFLEGVFDMYRLPAAVVIVNVKENIIAVKEAITRGIATVGIGDTNSNPTGIKYFIPANTSSLKSISLIMDNMASSIRKGQDDYKKRYSISA